VDAAFVAAYWSSYFKHASAPKTFGTDSSEQRRMWSKTIGLRPTAAVVDFNETDAGAVVESSEQCRVKARR
jgi:hypothetical protein